MSARDARDAVDAALAALLGGGRDRPEAWRALLDALPAGHLAAWLERRRWGGTRAGVRDARVAAVIPLPTATPAAWLVVDADVGGAPVRLQVPVAIAAARRDGAHLAAMRGGAWPLDLVDGPADAGFRDALLAALAGGAAAEGDGARLVAEPAPTAPDGSMGEGGAPSRVMGAEQSNTSIAYGDAAILKLYRRLERGEQPDVEMARFLGRVGFPHTPALLATLRLDDADGESVAGMLQRYLPGASDAWTHVLESGRRELAGALAGGSGAADARALGVVTRALHEALASDAADPAFAPEPVGAADVARWADAARRSVDEGLALLAERRVAGAVPRRAAEAADALAARGDEVRAAIAVLSARATPDAGARIRHHGDYHLGQVLHTPDGRWWIIDFEGEPARPLAERRARHSPLRDVAGMLRSFAYAAATLADEPSAPAGSRGARAAAAAAWERAAREAFLAGYAEAGSAAFLPRTADGRAVLVALFEIEKLFYELAYELRNRPDWSWIPIDGIARWRAAA